jgi:phosphatidylserine/phosphatidylglycerophosphate/cardiolipin synthase-like enzyme
MVLWREELQVSNEQRTKKWWAEGDTPVRNGSRVAYLVDGRTTMLLMCRYFLMARQYIYLANWGMTPAMEIVRGNDRRSGPEGSPAYEALVCELREEGLSEADIAFWMTHELSVQAVLGYAVSKGVEVKVLLWHSLFSHYDAQEAHRQLMEVGVHCILDDSAQGIIHHPVESLHQKISIVDGLLAFVGGVDPLIEKAGEFDRWDTPAHRFTTPLRLNAVGVTPHPWHDAHTLIEGTAAGDVELNFRQRWNDVVTRHHWDAHWLVPERPLPPPLASKSIVQVARTIPEHTYSFQPLIVRGIAQLYANALNNIEHFVYLENQYFWLRAYTGIDVPFIGGDSAEMEQNIRLLGAALQRGAAMTIILPDHPNVGRAFTDAGLARLRDEAPQAMEEGRLQVFCLATSHYEGRREHYRPIYVHAKVAIVDDIWATAGSGNLNNRGMRDDTEMNVATLDADLARSLRLTLQAEHLGLVQEDGLFALSRLLGAQGQSTQEQEQAIHILSYLEETLGDPITAMRMMHVRAWENLRLYKANQPLVGHLLPYLTANEAIQQGLRFNEEHGWLEEPAQQGV